MEVLALCTSRQTLDFVCDACNVEHAERLLVDRLANVEHREDLVTRTIAWAEAHPDGAVVALSDGPGLVQALALDRRPELAALRGASLDAMLATVDKAWARMNIVQDDGALRFKVLTDETTLPTDLGPRVIVKPLAGCASIGVEVCEAGMPVPALPHIENWTAELRRRRLGKDVRGVEGATALVEEYVGPEVPRVSVDGWISASGVPIPVAISDNIYVDGSPETFDYQCFPSRIGESAEAECWKLWKIIASRLVDEYGLRHQAFDIEMFVLDEGPAVMEINCRLHPNITPVLNRCLGIDLFAWHRDEHPTVPGNRNSAGAMVYVWAPKGEEPQWSTLISGLRYGEVLSRFEGAGPESGPMVCWGWLYVFGDDRAEALKRVAAIRELNPIGR